MINDEDQRAGRRVHSRREILAGATYGLGATLLFGRPQGSAATQKERRRPPTPRAAEDRWTGRNAMRLAGQGQPRSVCKGGGAVLVVGAGGDGDPVSWTNTGDARWPEHTLVQPAPGEPEVWGVAAHAGQFVAVGSMLQTVARQITPDDDVPGEQQTVTFTSARRRPTVWWTRDGARWSGRMLDDLDERHAQLISLSCHSNLLVAVGSTLDADGVQGDGGLVLTSDDHGHTWRRGEVAPGDVTLAEGSFTGVTMVDGRWFATSTDIEGGAVWTSDDGLRWSTLAPSARQFRGITLQGIGARHGRVYVAGTSLTDHTPRYFASADRCRTWQRLRPALKALSGSDVTVNDLTVVADDVVVVGTQRGAPIIEGAMADARD